MSGHVVPFEGHAHRDAERLLPWYANNTLDADERARVHRHLSECAACRADLAMLLPLAELDATGEATRDAADIDRDWARLRGRLHAQHRATSAPGFQRLRSGWRTSAPWMRVALAAQCALVAVLVAALFQSARDPAPAVADARDEAPYRTLSAEAAPTRVDRNDSLLVVFDPRLTDAQLRDLLGANHARIVDGPNAAGAFLVAAPPGQADLVRNALRASPGVAMAERLAPSAKEP